MKLLIIISVIPVLLLPVSALSSSDEAWKEFDKAIRESCLAKSNLQDKKVTGQRIDFSDDVGYSALVISGKTSNHGKSKTEKHLCLYNRAKQTASLEYMQ